MDNEDVYITAFVVYRDHQMPFSLKTASAMIQCTMKAILALAKWQYVNVYADSTIIV